MCSIFTSHSLLGSHSKLLSLSLLLSLLPIVLQQQSIFTASTADAIESTNTNSIGDNINLSYSDDSLLGESFDDSDEMDVDSVDVTRIGEAPLVDAPVDGKASDGWSREMATMLWRMKMCQMLPTVMERRRKEEPSITIQRQISRMLASSHCNFNQLGSVPRKGIHLICLVDWDTTTFSRSYV
jgi:hypothetical protein